MQQGTWKRRIQSEQEEPGGYINLCAGPTSCAPSVLKAMIERPTNSDLDPDYLPFHHQVEARYSALLGTTCPSYLLLGEAMLGLEASCRALLEKGERVLVLYNGYFGEGFSDLVAMAGAIPVPLAFDLQRGMDVERLKRFLEGDDDFVAATLVHCETPSGITNDIEALCQLLSHHGILTLVDSVSGIAGEAIDFDRAKIDVLIGGSQKCLSVPSGLTMVTLSEKAQAKIQSRRQPVESFYLNLPSIIEGSRQGQYPYTFAEGYLYALDEALERIEPDFVQKHRRYGEMVRAVCTQAGLSLYAKDHHSNTVTTLLLQEPTSDQEILRGLRKRGFLISGGIGHLKNRTVRIGHMGENNRLDWFKLFFEAFQDTLIECGVPLKASMPALFETHIQGLEAPAKE